MKTKNIFCANEQEITSHKVTVDTNGELLFTCECGRFVKLPGDTQKAEITKALDRHEEANQGQVTQAAVEEQNQAKLTKLLDSEN